MRRLLDDRMADAHVARIDSTLGHDQRGALFAEYAAVLVVVSLVIALALTGLGIPLSSLYAYTEFVLGLPIP